MTEHELKQHVENALDRDPSFDADDIGVSVDGGVVTLRGDVGSYTAKAAAEHAALRVYGVKAVANELTVKLASGYERSDSDIAQAAVAALSWNSLIPANQLTVAISDGWITLNGTADWRYQKEAAARAVRELAGVKGVTNGIVVKPRVQTGDVAADEVEHRPPVVL